LTSIGASFSDFNLWDYKIMLLSPPSLEEELKESFDRSIENGARAL
jgi:hypothetical protein